MARIKVNKKKLRWYLLLGVAAYLFFVMISLPASLLTRHFLTGSGPTQSLQLQNVRGTLWQGEVLDARYGRIKLGKLDWQLNPWGLLAADVDMHIKFGQHDTQGKGDIALGFGGKLDMQDMDLRLPAADMVSLLTDFPVGVSGTALAKIERFEFKKKTIVRGKGRLLWQQARLIVPHNVDLGDVLIEIEPQNNNTRLTITDQGEKGQLKIDVKFDMSASGRYRWEGTLKPRDPSQEKLVELVKFIGGRADNSGNYWISRSGQLRDW